MEKTFYNSKVDWWVYAVVIGTALYCAVIGLIIKDILLMSSLGIGFALCMIVAFASVKYQICDRRLGIRNFLYKWEWFPVDKISEVKKTTGILSSAALSTRRVAIKFSDRSILKSSMPLEISPKDRDGFITRLKEINPDIEVK